MMGFITHFCKNIKLAFVLVFMMFAVSSACAEDIGVVHARGVVSKQGEMLVSTRFNVSLPSQLGNALKQGVSLNFKLVYSLDAPTYTAYKLKLSNWFAEGASVNYKLSYNPLVTKGYRVRIGTLTVGDYATLEEALLRIGGISNWTVLSKGTLDGISVGDIRATVRLSLSMDDLPKPFQINGLTSRKWNLDSGWVRVAISKERK